MRKLGESCTPQKPSGDVIPWNFAAAEGLAKGPGKGAGKGPGKGPPKGGGKAAGKSKGRSELSGDTHAFPAKEPKRPEVRPTVQVKKLYWNSFRVDEPSLSPRKTVWDEISVEEPPIDTHELEILFADEPPSSPCRAPGGRSPPGSPEKLTAKKIRVFADQRRRQICVMLARLPETDTVLKAILHLDSESLGRDHVELLVKNAPSEDEVLRLQNLVKEADELGVWDTAELFMLSLIEIPHFELRLQVWHFENTFAERLDPIVSAQSAIAKGCECLFSSVAVKHLLGIILRSGNHLNGGTPRGQADGFAVDTLAQLQTMKFSHGDRAGTLVDYITQQMEKAYPGELAKMFEPGSVSDTLKQAARHKLCELVEETLNFKSVADQLLRSLRGSVKDTDEILSKHVESIKTMVAELAAMRASLEQMETKYVELSIWFNNMSKEKTKISCEDFFSIWNKFFTDVQRARDNLLAQEKRNAIERKNALQHLRRISTPRRMSVPVDLHAANYGDEWPPSPKTASRRRFTPRRNLTCGDMDLAIQKGSGMRVSTCAQPAAADKLVVDKSREPGPDMAQMKSGAEDTDDN